MRKAANESASFSNLSPKKFLAEYFLAADRRDIDIIGGDKNLIAFISLLLIQMKYIQKIIFLKKVCLRVDFPSKVSVQVPSHTSVNKVRRKMMKIRGSSWYK